MNVLYLIPAILIITVFLLIRAEFREDLSKIRIFKPVSTFLLISIALLSFLYGSSSTAYSAFILLGLLFSFGGDMALMFRHNNKMFRLGLIFFILAHVIYTAVFASYAGFSRHDIYGTLAMAVPSSLVFLYLRRGLGEMTVAVIFYIIIISFMVVKAFTAFYSPRLSNAQAVMITTGALLFYVSDVILAIARFRKPFKYNRISLAFYYSGQALIAFSTHMFGY